MDDLPAQYALFLAQAVTVVVAVVVGVAGVAAVVRRGQRRSGATGGGAASGRAGTSAGWGPSVDRRPGLHVRDLGRRHDDLALALRAGTMPPDRAKKELKAHRKRRKDEAKGRDAAPSGTTGPDGGRPRVWVLDFAGDMRASRVSSLREEVTALLTIATPRDEVVVRLENPGGLVSDHGLAAAQLLRLRSRGIRLTVAVDRVAASGGYMMACVADRIVAAPFAAVGSIGVIAGIPNVHRLLDRVGVDYEQFKGGEHKRTVTVFGRTTDEDRQKFDEEIKDTHALFKEFVVEHRPQVDLARVATGEFWYGTRAVELNLVDELTTSDDYLLARRPDADLYAVSYVPPRTPASRLAALRTAVEAVLAPPSTRA